MERRPGIIRSIWNTSDPGGVTVEGQHYQVHGTARGPQPAHDIGIWVPAGGPRRRRLVAEKADAWIAGGAWLSDVDGELTRPRRRRGRYIRRS